MTRGRYGFRHGWFLEFAAIFSALLFSVYPVGLVAVRLLLLSLLLSLLLLKALCLVLYSKFNHRIQQIFDNTSNPECRQ